MQRVRYKPLNAAQTQAYLRWGSEIPKPKQPSVLSDETVPVKPIRTGNTARDLILTVLQGYWLENGWGITTTANLTAGYERAAAINEKCHAKYVEEFNQYKAAIQLYRTTEVIYHSNMEEASKNTPHFTEHPPEPDPKAFPWVETPLLEPHLLTRADLRAAAMGCLALEREGAISVESSANAAHLVVPNVQAILGVISSKAA